MMKPVSVICAGPEAEQDRYGDEFPIWTVFTVNEDGDDVGKSYTCRSYDRAIALANEIARDRGLELILEASRS